MLYLAWESNRSTVNISDLFYSTIHMKNSENIGNILSVVNYILPVVNNILYVVNDTIPVVNNTLLVVNYIPWKDNFCKSLRQCKYHSSWKNAHVTATYSILLTTGRI
jgi:hypothetical protein